MIDPLHRRKPSFGLGEQPHRKLKQAGQLSVQGEKETALRVNVQQLYHEYSLSNNACHYLSEQIRM